jgi:hypothetical protein
MPNGSRLGSWVREKGRTFVKGSALVPLTRSPVTVNSDWFLRDLEPPVLAGLWDLADPARPPSL